MSSPSSVITLGYGSPYGNAGLILTLGYGAIGAGVPDDEYTSPIRGRVFTSPPQVRTFTSPQE